MYAIRSYYEFFEGVLDHAVVPVDDLVITSYSIHYTKLYEEGITPQEVVDRYHGMIKDSFEKFGISFDVYSRTSNPIHHETASQFFTTLYNKGEFIEKTSLQYYDETHNVFLAARYITGTCPSYHFV